MPQTTGTQQLKLKQAWEYFERHPKCTSLTECGIAHDSRVARTDACNELRQALEERRELMAAERRHLGLPRKDARGLGYRFGDRAMVNEPAPKRLRRTGSRARGTQHSTASTGSIYEASHPTERICPRSHARRELIEVLPQM